MITNELNGLLKEYEFKKNVLDTQTDKIAEGIREWCINEKNRIDAEGKAILVFLATNWDKVNHLFNRSSSPDGRGYYDGCGFRIDFTYCGSTEFFKAAYLSTEYEYKHNLGRTWTNLPKPSIKYSYMDKDRDTYTSVDYWIEYKKCLAIANESLCALAERCKEMLNTLISEQKKRCDEMMKAVKDIEESETKTIELKVEVRV